MLAGSRGEGESVPLGDITCTLKVRGQDISVLQVKRPRTDEDNTGWQVWECSNVMLRYATDETALSIALGTCTRLLDLSAGAGLIAITLATLGSSCAASETDSQLPHLELNVRRSGPLVSSRIPILRHYWGDDVLTLRPPWVQCKHDTTGAGAPWYDLALASDIVFIALRDGFVRELSLTLRRLSLVCTNILLGFEERLIREETAFMESLGQELQGCSSAEDSAPLIVEEISRRWCMVSKEDRLRGVGGAEEGVETGDVFWESPPVRMFTLSRRR